MNSQMQGANFLSDFNGPTNSGTIANANDLFALQQQQQLQLQQQLNLAAQYGSIVNMGNILANSSSLTNDDQDDEEQEEEDEHNVEYDDENSSPSDYVIQQQQQQQQMIEQNNIQQQQLFFLQQQQQQQQQQQMIEQNNIQINDANYFLINNPHLFNNSNDDNNSMILQQNQLQQQLIMVNSKLAVGQQTSSTGELVSSSHKTTVTKKLKDSHKIMPVKRPGLKLKTPIAYFGNTDPSVIPIQKDGMGVCEKCGAIGVKHAFYTKERRFCSLSCARGFEEIGDTGNSSNSKSKKSAYKFKMEEMVHIKDENSGKSQSSSASSTLHNFMPQESMPQLIKPMNGSSGGLEDRHLSIRRKVPSEFVNSYDWKEQIIRTDFYAASVTNFSHAPGYDIWSDIVVGIKVEVENLDLKETDTHGGSNFQSTPFWIATVLKIHGYKAKLRYEGFENDHNHDFWVNLCTTEVHPVGWCATQGRQIIAPLKIENRVKNLKKYLLKSLHHAKTLPGHFYNKLYESFRSRFEVGLILEVVDKECISTVKLARINKIVGKRLYVDYYDNTGLADEGFWCHEDSPLIHPVGWATTVGHKLNAPSDYIERMNRE